MICVRPGAGDDRGAFAGSDATLEVVQRLKLADEVTKDAAEAAREADLVMICTPVSTYGAIAETIAPTLKPGAIVTGITRKAFSERDDFRKYWEDKAATGRLGQPEDVAHAINFLLSEEASFISGIGLPVDGGAMAEM